MRALALTMDSADIPSLLSSRGKIFELENNLFWKRDRLLTFHPTHSAKNKVQASLGSGSRAPLLGSSFFPQASNGLEKTKIYDVTRSSAQNNRANNRDPSLDHLASTRAILADVSDDDKPFLPSTSIFRRLARGCDQNGVNNLASSAPIVSLTLSQLPDNQDYLADNEDLADGPAFPNPPDQSYPHHHTSLAASSGSRLHWTHQPAMRRHWLPYQSKVRSDPRLPRSLDTRGHRGRSLGHTQASFC